MPTDGQMNGIASIIAAFTGLITAIGILYNIIQNRRDNQNAQVERHVNKEELKQKLDTVEKQTDGIVSHLIEKIEPVVGMDDTAVHKAVKFMKDKKDLSESQAMFIVKAAEEAEKVKQQKKEDK